MLTLSKSSTPVVALNFCVKNFKGEVVLMREKTTIIAVGGEGIEVQSAAMAVERVGIILKG